MKKCNTSENANKKSTCSSHTVHRKTIAKNKKRRYNCYSQNGKYQHNTKSNHTCRVDPKEYVFYAVLNTDLRMDQGKAAAVIARSILKLHNQLDLNDTNSVYIDKWSSSGETILVLEGYDDSHLKHLKEEAVHAAIDTYALYGQYNHCQDIVVLSAFGLGENLEDIFEGLDTLV